MLSGWWSYQLHFVSEGVWECKLAVQQFRFSSLVFKLL
jgi:hypothetical protein